MFCAARATNDTSMDSQPRIASNSGTMNATVARIARDRSGLSDSRSANRLSAERGRSAAMWLFEPDCGHT